MQLVEQHSSSSKQSIDWVALTLAWNMEAFKNMTAKGGQLITLKQESHLRQYSKKVAKDASTMQFAALATAAAEGA